MKTTYYDNIHYIELLHSAILYNLFAIIELLSFTVLHENVHTMRACVCLCVAKCWPM